MARRISIDLAKAFLAAFVEPSCEGDEVVHPERRGARCFGRGARGFIGPGPCLDDDARDFAAPTRNAATDDSGEEADAAEAHRKEWLPILEAVHDYCRRVFGCEPGPTRFVRDESVRPLVFYRIEVHTGWRHHMVFLILDDGRRLTFLAARR